MSRTHGDVYDLAGARAENNVGKKFKDAGVVPFPEVDLERAAFASGIPEKRILKALRSAELPGRRVGAKHLIRIIDLWHFAVSLESEKLLSKNRR